MRLKTLFSIFVFFSVPFIFASNVSSSPAHHAPSDLLLFEKCYPDVSFSKKWDEEKNDWKLFLSIPSKSEKKEDKTAVFYWANGKMLPESELSHKEKWWSLLYHYDKTLRDPANFSKEEIERMRKFGSTQSRQEKAGSPMFFFDFLYDAWSEREIERHIVKTTFLGKNTKVHERIAPALSRVEKRILSKKDDEAVKSFIDTLTSADAYYWRQIAGTSRKSFHSYGIAIDVLPKRLYGKETYWNWAKEKRGENWMLTPLNERWSPPQSVVEIFESEGFIWGGKWAVWDTMHFEYHPELIAWNKIAPR